MAEMAVAMSPNVSQPESLSSASMAIDWRVTTPVLVLVTLMYIAPSVTLLISDRSGLARARPASSVNDP